MCGPVRNPAAPTVVIVGSSRGGTSLLFDLLASTGGFRALPGEHTPLYRTFGALPLDSPAADGDAVINADADEQGLADAMARHSQAIPEDPSRSWDVLRVAVLLERQWGVLGYPASRWRGVAERISRLPGGRGAERQVLQILESVPGVDIRYYDAQPEAHLSAAGVADGPPAPASPPIESPPFVVPLPAGRQAGDASPRPLLLKASVDAYRLRWLTSMLGDIRVIHLVRNPAASVNGLIGGWLSSGYFSYLLPEDDSLAMPGYTHRPWMRSWWNFDLPPGWRSLKNAALEDVCAAQWKLAHTAILTDLADTGLPHLRLRAEDLMNAETRAAVIGRVMGFCGVPNYRSPVPRVVMATVPPRAYRWHDCKALVEKSVYTDSVLDVAEQLGYGRSATSEWS